MTAKWLWDCIRLGESLSFDPYLVQATRDPNQSSKDSKTIEIPENPARAPKSDAKKAEAAERWVPNPLKKSLISEEEKKQFAKDAPPRRGPARVGKDPQPDNFSDLATKPPPKDEIQPPIYLDDDDTPMLLDSDLGDTLPMLDLPTISAPLREITPNSSPPKPPPPPPKEEPPSPTPCKPSEDPSLGPAISSLLAHHQRSNSAAARPNSSESSDQPRMYRRRRQLLGRAPSNLSSHSINLSRASSVDTMNTDGLGTPLENSNRSKSDINLNSSNLNNNKTKADFPTFYSADQNDDPDREEPPLQMTQLGYEDPDVAAWRERVAIKMSGGRVKEKGATPVKGANAGKGKAESGTLGIAKRTRLASGGR